MALNLVRGFRRIGWVLTLPFAALIVLAFYESTKVFSPANYEVAQTVDYYALAKQAGAISSTPPPTLPADFFSKLDGAQKQVEPPPGTRTVPHAEGSDYVVELSGIGTVWFSQEVPKDVVEQVLRDFKAKHKPRPALEIVSEEPLPAGPPPKAAGKQRGPWENYRNSSKIDLSAGLVNPKVDLSDLGATVSDASAMLWTFTVHKQVSKLRLVGLIIGAVSLSALFIQGFISVLAWVLRGFRG